MVRFAWVGFVLGTLRGLQVPPSLASGKEYDLLACVAPDRAQESFLQKEHPTAEAPSTVRPRRLGPGRVPDCHARVEDSLRDARGCVHVPNREARALDTACKRRRCEEMDMPGWFQRHPLVTERRMAQAFYAKLVLNPRFRSRFLWARGGASPFSRRLPVSVVESRHVGRGPDQKSGPEERLREVYCGQPLWAE